MWIIHSYALRSRRLMNTVDSLFLRIHNWIGVRSQMLHFHPRIMAESAFPPFTSRLASQRVIYHGTAASLLLYFP